MNEARTGRTASYLPRILPFGLFMSFIGIEEIIRFLAGKGFLYVDQELFYYLYPFKALTVLAVLLFLRSEFSEIIPKDILLLKDSAVSISAGIAVFVLWVNMDWKFATFGTLHGYNPDLISSRYARPILIAFRLSSAAVIVPVMEELFWRSFLNRYLIASDFMKISTGRFTTASFVITAVMFGLEHNLWLAGIMAGIMYNIVLLKTESIAQCILSHSVTNLLLGLYVLKTGQWQFW